MADISFNRVTNDIVIVGGDLIFTSDTGFTETMRQRIRAVLNTFLGEWFLDDPDDPAVGVPYFQSLFEQKLPTMELADTIFRTVLLNVEDVTGVQSLNFDYEISTRVLNITFSVSITGGAIVEDIIDLTSVITGSSQTVSLAQQQINTQSHIAGL